MVFHEVLPGKFKMGDNQVDTEITKPFAMMQTLVTQWMWANLKIAMGEKEIDMINPSIFKEGEDSSVFKNMGGINKDIQMNADHPVENVSWVMIDDFIDGLNRLSKSDDLKIQKILENLIPDHKKGDIYDFPTEAQWEFVMRNRGRANQVHYNKSDDKELGNYAHYFANSKSDQYPEGSTHVVATKLPRMIDVGDGKKVPFYDLEGNVNNAALSMKEISNAGPQLPYCI